MKKVVLLGLFVLLLTQSACLRVPPRCKMEGCNVVIDHNHVFGAETRANETKDVSKVWRGVPYFTYIFRKKYKAQESRGYYRKVDTREAFDKGRGPKLPVVSPKKKSKPKPKTDKPKIDTKGETQPAEKKE